MKNDMESMLRDLLLSDYGSKGIGETFFKMAQELEAKGKQAMAATAYDRAYGLDPDNSHYLQARNLLLDQLAVVVKGIKFCYIPGGSFLMGSETGEPDEQPVHPVEVKSFWISETQISWAAFADLAGWEAPPNAFPKERSNLTREAAFFLREGTKIRLQYCEDSTVHATDWHVHAPELKYAKLDSGEIIPASSLFGEPDRADPKRPWKYDQKPMVCVSLQEIDELCRKISGSKRQFRLPTEAEWEKAARGGLINAKYPWGDELPSKENCDFHRFHEFSILPMRKFRPNGYGLYGMSGGVWEWISDWYDSEYYQNSPTKNPQGPSEGSEKVLRGGSWADCAEAVTVSYRMSRSVNNRGSGKWEGHFTPNIGFRLVMTS